MRIEPIITKYIFNKQSAWRTSIYKSKFIFQPILQPASVLKVNKEAIHLTMAFHIWRGKAFFKKVVSELAKRCNLFYQALTDLAYSDPDSKLGPLLIPSADKLTLDVKFDSLTYLFINDGNTSVKQQLIDNYRAEPAIPFTSKATITNENFGAVSKAYIKTLQDNVISPRLQDRMIAAAGIKSVYSINSSHSPFLAQSKAVSDLLIVIGQ